MLNIYFQALPQKLIIILRDVGFLEFSNEQEAASALYDYREDICNEPASPCAINLSELLNALVLY